MKLKVEVYRVMLRAICLIRARVAAARLMKDIEVSHQIVHLVIASSTALLCTILATPTYVSHHTRRVQCDASRSTPALLADPEALHSA